MTHTCPCIMDYETDTVAVLRRAGRILVVVGPKWGTSLGQIQDEKFGPAGALAGVMTQLTLDTKDGTINVIGSYWPNKHSAGDTSD